MSLAPRPCTSFIAIALASASACGGSSGAGVERTGPTYYADVKPILDAKCTSCHDGAGIAPFALKDYATVASLKAAIRTAVTDRVMPPWLPGPGCTEYVADRSLSVAQIATITDWVDTGAAEGDPASAGEPLDTGPSYALSRVDATLEMPVSYQAKAAEGDDYRCFVIDWPEDVTRYVTGFRVSPGAIRSVHHVIAFLAPPTEVQALQALDDADPGPGYGCYGGPTVQAGWLGVWTPGSGGADFPEGTGIEVTPGSKIVMQVHYSALNGPPEPDQSAIDVRLADSVAKRAWIQPWADPSWYADGAMLIPAGDPDVMVSSSFDPTIFVSSGQSFLMYSVGLHMHELGSRGRLDIQRSDGTADCLLDIPRWNSHWQGGYGLAEPRRLDPGDRIYQECHFDNSPENQIIVDGKPAVVRDVDWGESVRDEMCLAAFYLSTL